MVRAINIGNKYTTHTSYVNTLSHLFDRVLFFVDEMMNFIVQITCKLRYFHLYHVLTKIKLFLRDEKTGFICN